MAMFATTAELEDFADTSLTFTRAILAIELASSACESAAKSSNATIEQVVGDERTIDGSGTPVVTLPAWPVTAVTAITIGDDPVTDFSWSLNGVLERTSGVWPKGRRNISVTFTHGFADVPSEIKLVALQVAARIVGNPQGLTQFGSDGVSGSFSPNLLNDREHATVLRALR